MTVLPGNDLTTTAVRRHAEPPRLIALIRGDLDWIVMKALEKERARRYETANGLAMDIQRHLSNEPVIARPPSRVYRLQKLVRRNKVVFVAAAAVAAALIAGLGASTWLFLEEREARQRAVAAELQQTRLAQEAELARSNEAKLRRQAEARERITQAEILISQGRFNVADTMIGDAPPTEPSVEDAAVLRSLGDWHALEGRWTQAADRFDLLLQANQLDGWDISTLDFLRCGVSLVESGAGDHDQRFRQTALSRFATTSNGVVAERIVKICLLSSPSQSLAESLAPLARVAGESFATVDSHDPDAAFRAAWGSVSLALWEYRRGRYASTIEWAGRCLACPQFNAPRAAAAHLELAMAFSQSSDRDQALKELSLGRQSVEEEFSGALEPGSATQGFWFDWVFARILLREATDLIAPRPSLSP